MRFRLRYLQHDLELNEGTFAVGRNASCQLSLDDPLVSRRHALFEVQNGQVSVEDLNSRNGVIDRRIYLNGYVAAADCDRGEWAFRDGKPCTLGEPVLVHYDALYKRPYPHFVED